MKTIVAFFVFAALLFAGWPVGAQESIGPLEALQEALGHSNALAISGLEREQAELAFRQSRAERNFQLEIDAAPLYSYGSTETAGIPTQTHSWGAGVNLSRALPTGGGFSIQADYRFDVVVTGETETSTLYAQAPSLSLQMTQPVFVNGRFIDPRLYSAPIAAALSTAETARTLERNARNQFILRVLDLFFQTARERAETGNLREELALSEELNRSMERSLEAGGSTYAELREIEARTVSLREQLFALEYSLACLERELGQCLDPETGLLPADLVFSVPDTPGLADAETSPPVAVENAPAVVQAAADLRAAELAVAASGTASTLSLSCFLAPRYPTATLGAESLEESFSLFGEDGASVDFRLDVALSVPAYTSGARTDRGAAARAAVEAAALRLAEARTTAQRREREYLGSIEYLAECVNLSRQTAELYDVRYREALRYADFGRATERDVRAALLESERRTTASRRAESDLFLARLRRLSDAGSDLLEVLGLE